jgi:tetratricopeptide (TPR) repeat protein
MEKTPDPETNCPYKNVMNKMKFSFFNRDNDKLNSTMEDTERGIEMNSNVNTNNKKSECPYKAEERKKEEFTEKESKEMKESKSKEAMTTDNKSDDEENAPTGGCPVMNNTKKDPANKHFERYYEIPRFGPFDFMFLMRGMLEDEEYFEKTKKIRHYPRHMKYTLFYQNQEKLQKVHEKEFPMVFFIYDEIKEKGNRMFRRKKYREAVEHYTYAYGLLKWIEFKDKKKQEEFLKKPSLDPILDSDIIEKKVYLDDVKVEEDSYKACVVYLLMNLSYAYMELRHYSEAVDCLDECMEIAEDKVPDLYFRRSQARTYNSNSTEEELEKAFNDIEKAIQLKDDPMYKEHRDILLKIIESRVNEEAENTKKLLTKAKKSYERIKERHINEDEVIYTKNKDAITQYKILKE